MNKSIEQIKTQLKHKFSSNDVLTMWNTYCDSKNYDLNKIYKNNAAILDKWFCSASDLASLINGTYTYKDNYFWVDDCGFITSFSNIFDDKGPVQLDELAEWILNTGTFLEQFEIN